MFYSIRLIKKINFDFLKKYTLYQRQHNIPKKTFFKTRIIIIRGLYTVTYNNIMYNRHFKYGMFSFTRKPFARPLKKSKLKKR